MQRQAPSRLRNIVSAPFTWLGNALPVSGSILLLVTAGAAIGPRSRVMTEELAAYGFIGHLLWAAGLGVAAFVRSARRPLWQLPLVLPVVLAFGALSALPAFATGFSIVILGIGLAGPVTFPVDLTLPCLGVVFVASSCALKQAAGEISRQRRARPATRLALGAAGLFWCVAIAISEQERATLEDRLQSAPPEERIAAYTRNLSASFPRTRAWAARGLSGLGPRAYSAVPALAAALGDPWFQARVDAIGALGSIGPEAQSAIPAMIRTVRDAPPPLFNQDPSEREMLQKPLVKAILAIAPERLPELLAAYSPKERYWMVNHMSSYLHEQAPTAVPALCRILEGPDRFTRPAAAYALTWLVASYHDPGVVDCLVLATDDPDLRHYAVGALGLTKDPRARPRVRSLTEHADEHTRAAPAEALGALFTGAATGPELEEAVGRLAQMAQKESHRVRISAIQGLARIGTGARSAIPSLQRIAASPDKDLSWWARYALDRVALEK